MRVGVYGLAFIIALGPSIPRLTGACSVLPRYNWDFGDAPMIPSDTTPPTLALTSRVERPDDFLGCGCGRQCPATGYIVFEPTAMDDRTPVEFITYRFEIVNGRPPSYAYFQGNEYGVDYDGVIGFSFDGDTEYFSFDVKVTAIDINGNESAPVVVTIEG